jgi:hypothetical protein
MTSPSPLMMCRPVFHSVGMGMVREVVKGGEKKGGWVLLLLVQLPPMLLLTVQITWVGLVRGGWWVLRQTQKVVKEAETEAEAAAAEEEEVGGWIVNKPPPPRPANLTSPPSLPKLQPSAIVDSRGGREGGFSRVLPPAMEEEEEEWALLPLPSLPLPPVAVTLVERRGHRRPRIMRGGGGEEEEEVCQ